MSVGMYSTKTFNPKKVETGYLSHGDPYDKVDKRRIDKEELLNVANWKRHTGEQFHVVAPKKGQTAGYFSTFSYAPDTYQEHVPYLDREPPAERPSGFGTRDARRRDEFTNHIKAQQYKEIISREYKKKETSKAGTSNDVYLTTAQQVAAHAREKSEQATRLQQLALGQTATAATATATATATAAGSQSARTAPVGKGSSGSGSGSGGATDRWYSPDYKAAADNKTANNVFQSNSALPPIAFFQNAITKHTYDIGKASNATTPICHKCSRETFYCKHRIGASSAQTARYIGHYKTTQMQIGHGHTQAYASIKPVHGRKGTLNAFRDYTHLATTYS